MADLLIILLAQTDPFPHRLLKLHEGGRRGDATAALENISRLRIHGQIHDHDAAVRNRIVPKNFEGNEIRVALIVVWLKRKARKFCLARFQRGGSQLSGFVNRQFSRLSARKRTGAQEHAHDTRCNRFPMTIQTFQ